jgi:hypothetical protein
MYSIGLETAMSRRSGPSVVTLLAGMVIWQPFHKNSGMGPANGHLDAIDKTASSSENAAFRYIVATPEWPVIEVVPIPETQSSLRLRI